jgi:hypothetical protein
MSHENAHWLSRKPSACAHTIPVSRQPAMLDAHRLRRVRSRPDQCAPQLDRVPPSAGVQRKRADHSEESGAWGGRLRSLAGGVTGA